MRNRAGRPGEAAELALLGRDYRRSGRLQGRTATIRSRPRCPQLRTLTAHENIGGLGHSQTARPRPAASISASARVDGRFGCANTMVVEGRAPAAPWPHRSGTARGGICRPMRSASPFGTLASGQRVGNEGLTRVSSSSTRAPRRSRTCAGSSRSWRLERLAKPFTNGSNRPSPMRPSVRQEVAFQWRSVCPTSGVSESVQR